MTGFASLKLPAPILAALDEMGYAEPTPVQAASLAPLLAGRDALVQAQTGSGKTTAFGIPSVIIGSRGAGLRSLVLVPTRELARQVALELRALGKGSPFRCVAVTGGVQQEQEERTLGGDVRCLVATPGRLLALLEAKKVKLDRVELVVLDEADRMLDLGFLKEVERVLEALPAKRQTVLVSATLDSAVWALVQRHLRDPADVRVDTRAIPPSLDHYRLNVFEGQKEPAILGLLKKEDPQRAIVFLRTRERVVAFTKLLKQAGFAADPLQGDMSHDQRRHVFDLFARGVSRILVATDLASRGLDVPEMELVVNVDVPQTSDDYLHRAGRAARMGRAGRVVSFILPHEKDERLQIERAAGAELKPYRLEIPKPPEGEREGVREGRQGPRPRASAPARRDAEPKARPPTVRGPKRADEEGDVPPSRKGRARRS